MLSSISPIDGRYADRTTEMDVFSEESMTMTRMSVELAWMDKFLRVVGDNYKIGPTSVCSDDAISVKNMELKTRHDIKAIEYVLREQLGPNAPLWALHFGLTSDDVSNIAYAVSIQSARCRIRKLQLLLILKLSNMARTYKSIPMLARTHGQPASPTTLGKELAIFAVRLHRQKDRMMKVPIYGKLAGATGNFNALHHACPNTDWIRVSKQFVESYGLTHTLAVTQTEPHDGIAELFDAIAGFNTVMIDLCRDMWQYISVKYFDQIKETTLEVGSSTMPHKINPIDFENAEGNCGVSTAMLSHMSKVLPISRLQRDLTDSTTMRNIGVALAHHVIALKSLHSGLRRVSPNIQIMRDDIVNNKQILSELVQTMERWNNRNMEYEKWVSTDWESYIKLHLPGSDEMALAYTGKAEEITEELIRSIEQ